MKPSIIKLVLFVGFLICLLNCGEKSINELPLLVSYDFEDGKTIGWQPNIPGNWQVVNVEDLMVYELVSPGEQGKIRAPTSWSVLVAYDVTSFEFSGRLKNKADTENKNRDTCVFFHFQDPTHFYYVHFSAKSDGAHNIIGLVNGADRVKVNVEPAGESVFRLTDTEWHEFKVTCETSTGEIKAFLDDMETPILTTKNLTLTHGLVGIGSFDDTGYFDDIKLWGKRSLK
ncbi:MAG: hypothetical protein ISS41_03090 [Candidatus Aminicenantes bacterium]|nr:hypothetical protein [Candidatus Aminicenantes bacterium]MBL7082603.1 hypothetical protein [Candidatus Aminicenantes bacterium]